MIISNKSTPYFMSTDYGELFVLHYKPVVITDKYPNKLEKKQAILYIPAFAEEMNKARRMVAMQAQAFCKSGYSVLVLDLFGTGDSQGDFSDATWAMWLSNIESAINWLRNEGVESVSLWGLRIGALLAMDFLQYHPEIKIDRLICWQPVLKGEIFALQFLRLRVASAMMDKNAPQEKVSDLKRLLETGTTIEVAGYGLNPQLMVPMMALQARQLNLSNMIECNVFELVSGGAQQASHATRQWVEDMRQSGLEMTLDTVVGSNFWATQEIAEVPELINTTVRRLN